MSTNLTRGNRLNAKSQVKPSKTKPQLHVMKLGDRSKNEETVEKSTVFRLMDSKGKALVPKLEKSNTEKPKKVTKPRRKKLSPEEKLQRFKDTNDKNDAILLRKAKDRAKSNIRATVVQPKARASALKIWNKPIKVVNNKPEVKQPQNLVITKNKNKSEKKIMSVPTGNRKPAQRQNPRALAKNAGVRNIVKPKSTGPQAMPTLNIKPVQSKNFESIGRKLGASMATSQSRMGKPMTAVPLVKSSGTTKLMLRQSGGGRGKTELRRKPSKKLPILASRSAEKTIKAKTPPKIVSNSKKVMQTVNKTNEKEIKMVSVESKQQADKPQERSIANTGSMGSVKKMTDKFSKKEPEAPPIVSKDRSHALLNFPFQQTKATFEKPTTQKNYIESEKTVKKVKAAHDEPPKATPRTDLMKIVHAMREHLNVLECPLTERSKNTNDGVRSTLSAIRATRDKFLNEKLADSTQSKPIGLTLEAQNLQRRAQLSETRKPLERAYLDSMKHENKMIEKRKIQQPNAPTMANTASLFKEEIKATFDGSMINLAQKYTAQLEDARLVLGRRLNAL